MITVSMGLVYRLSQDSPFVIDDAIDGVSTAFYWPSSSDCS